MNLECLSEALKSGETSLTFAALAGLRKQSVRGAERLLSGSVASYLESRGFRNEAHYFRTIYEWHMASDSRGLSQLQRSKFNYNMLNMILDEFLPWHNENYDVNVGNEQVTLD